VGKATGRPQLASSPDAKQADPTDGDSAAATGDGQEKEPVAVTANNGATTAQTEAQKQTSVAAMIPKILRVSRLILTSRSFFFSYDLDLTRSIATLNGIPQAPMKGTLDPLVRESLMPCTMA
jgi:SacI homology domain